MTLFRAWFKSGQHLGPGGDRKNAGCRSRHTRRCRASVLIWVNWASGGYTGEPEPPLCVNSTFCVGPGRSIELEVVRAAAYYAAGEAWWRASCKGQSKTAAGGETKVQRPMHDFTRSTAGRQVPFMSVVLSGVGDGFVIRAGGSFHRWLRGCARGGSADPGWRRSAVRSRIPRSTAQTAGSL